MWVNELAHMGIVSFRSYLVASTVYPADTHAAARYATKAVLKMLETRECVIWK